MPITNIEIIAQIRNNKTGEVVEYKCETYLNEDDNTPSFFSWAENNYSCDCNRELSFIRAKGENSEVDSVECGQGKFSVNLIDTRDNKVFYKEF